MNSHMNKVGSPNFVRTLLKWLSSGDDPAYLYPMKQLKMNCCAIHTLGKVEHVD
jgi:hypothetical protein